MVPLRDASFLPRVPARVTSAASNAAAHALVAALDVSGGHTARLGPMPTKEEVIEAMRQVEDPELGMDIVELGLLYDVEVSGQSVKVTHSLTSMGCPAGPMIEEGIYEAIARVPGVEAIEAELTWDPPWSPEKMSDDAKFILGFG